MKYYEVMTRSDTHIVYDLEDLVQLMKEENDIELLDQHPNPIQFNIDRDIKYIRNMHHGMIWKHALAVVKCFEE